MTLTMAFMNKSIKRNDLFKGTSCTRLQMLNEQVSRILSTSRSRFVSRNARRVVLERASHRCCRCLIRLRRTVVTKHQSRFCLGSSWNYVTIKQRGRGFGNAMFKLLALRCCSQRVSTRVGLGWILDNERQIPNALSR